jgi:hypothetical protein
VQVQEALEGPPLLVGLPPKPHQKSHTDTSSPFLHIPVWIKKHLIKNDLLSAPSTPTKEFSIPCLPKECLAIHCLNATFQTTSEAIHNTRDIIMEYHIGKIATCFLSIHGLSWTGVLRGPLSFLTKALATCQRCQNTKGSFYWSF